MQLLVAIARVILLVIVGQLRNIGPYRDHREVFDISGRVVNPDMEADQELVPSGAGPSQPGPNSEPYLESGD